MRRRRRLGGWLGWAGQSTCAALRPGEKRHLTPLRSGRPPSHPCRIMAEAPLRCDRLHQPALHHPAAATFPAARVAFPIQLLTKITLYKYSNEQGFKDALAVRQAAGESRFEVA